MLEVINKSLQSILRRGVFYKALSICQLYYLTVLEIKWQVSSVPEQLSKLTAKRASVDRKLPAQLLHINFTNFVDVNKICHNILQLLNHDFTFNTREYILAKVFRIFLSFKRIISGCNIL